MSNEIKVPPLPTGPVPWRKAFAQIVLSDMLRIRRMEEKAAELYRAEDTRLSAPLHW